MLRGVEALLRRPCPETWTHKGGSRLSCPNTWAYETDHRPGSRTARSPPLVTNRGQAHRQRKDKRAGQAGRASEEGWIRCGMSFCLEAARAFWWSKMIPLFDYWQWTSSRMQVSRR